MLEGSNLEPSFDRIRRTSKDN